VPIFGILRHQLPAGKTRHHRFKDLWRKLCDLLMLREGWSRVVGTTVAHSEVARGLRAK
jgi:hypothetical protein